MNDTIGSATNASNNINRSLERESSSVAEREQNANQETQAQTSAPRSEDTTQINQSSAAFAQQSTREVSTNISSSDEAIVAVQELRAAIANNPEAANNAYGNISQTTVEATL